MGIKGLQTIIDNNLSDICGAAKRIQGHLVIDGVNLLHELYLQHNLDWANGGCYYKVREITIRFFDELLRTGVNPIVIMDGTGCENSLKDKVCRRNLSIGDIPGCIARAHSFVPSAQCHGELRHFLPELARMTFVCTVKETNNVPLYFADGKADITAVKLANFYDCPVLVNDTKYCIFDIRKGVVLYRHLKIDLDNKLCSGHIIEKSRPFQCYFCLNDHRLAIAMVAILGDGGPELPELYIARSDLKRMIDTRLDISHTHDGEKYRVINVAKFLENFRTQDEFEDKISSFRMSENFKSQLEKSCEKASTLYTYLSPPASMSCKYLQNHTKIMCSRPCELPEHLFHQFREGDLPNYLVDAIALGKTCLCQQVGDVNQPPVVKLGIPIREAAYGFARKLMSHRSSKEIIEYHRNAFGAKKGLSYSEHQAEPDHSTRKRLGATKITELDEGPRKVLAREAICNTFGCQLENISNFDNNEENSWILVVALTRYWAQQQLERQSLPNNHIIKSLVYSFIRCSSRVNTAGYEQPQPQGYLPDTFSDPNWIKAYHAALEWQCLYSDTIGLNAILMQPFKVQSPACLYDGEVVMHYAVCGGVEAQVECLNPRERQLYDKLLAAIMPA